MLRGVSSLYGNSQIPAVLTSQRVGLDPGSSAIPSQAQDGNISGTYQIQTRERH